MAICELWERLHLHDTLWIKDEEVSYFSICSQLVNHRWKFVMLFQTPNSHHCGFAEEEYENHICYRFKGLVSTNWQ